MTAYLQPGDKIHVAFPINAAFGRSDAETIAAEEARKLTAAFAMHGVTVTSYWANSALTAPVVVAVFRPASPEQS